MTYGSDASPIAKESRSEESAQRSSAPRWIPISLLAFSTVALVGPVVLLRRHKASLLTKALEEAPPPPRRATTSTALGVAGIAQPRQHIQPTPAHLAPQDVQSSSHESVDDFNGALHSAKAFGYATLMVMAGALTAVWGVQAYMGVDNASATLNHFASRMRSSIQTNMPGLMAKLHRPSTDPSTPGTLSPTHPGAKAVIEHRTEKVEWSWPDAEQRLRMAFEQGGFSGWADAVMRELELESEMERQRRGQT
ncbi:hypothetical protein BC835DRAFT_1273831 [Cytidiella melzeri]|nr:hypothetical protein BC835DRAFT_1273831 [Cytidiella melzeri]